MRRRIQANRRSIFGIPKLSRTLTPEDKPFAGAFRTRFLGQRKIAHTHIPAHACEGDTVQSLFTALSCKPGDTVLFVHPYNAEPRRINDRAPRAQLHSGYIHFCLRADSPNRKRNGTGGKGDHHRTSRPSAQISVQTSSEQALLRAILESLRGLVRLIEPFKKESVH